MDPLTISASIVGFLSFLHEVSILTSKIVTAKRDEEDVIKEFKTEIQHLESILSSVQLYSQELQEASPGNDSVDFSDLEACLRECRSRLKNFVNKLEQSNTRGKALIKRWKWPLRQEEGMKLAELVNRCKCSLQLQLALKQGRVMHRTTMDIQTKAAVTHERTSIIQRGEIVKRLDIVDVNATFDKAREKCHPRTGNWFLTSPQFGRFKSESSEHLWLHGMPGAGKTILSGSIIAVLRDHVKDQPTHALAYFFFSYRAEDKQNVYNMLSSIAGQLCRKAITIPEKVVTELESNMARLPTSVLLDIISCLTQSFSMVYIILDALDEIKIDERSSLIRTLQYIVRSLGINLLMTSRREDYLINGFNALPLQEMALATTIVDQDIRLYVSETFSNAAGLWQWDAELCEMTDKIVETLTKRAQGMFRWVDCQVENLKDCRRACDVEDALNSLPEDLDDTYKRILLLIEKRYRAYAARLLAWITFSQRELCVDVLAEAIIFEPDTSELDPERRFKNTNNIIGICRNLISSSIRKYCKCHPMKPKYMNCHHTLSLSHYSVKEYLLSERFKRDEELTVYSSLFEKGFSYITEVWTKYWQMVISRYRPGLGGAEMWWDCLPLLKHCISASVDHAKYLESGTARREWAQRVAHLACDNFNLITYALQEDAMFIWWPVSLCVNYGLYEGIEVFKARGYDVHSIVYLLGEPTTPLSWALSLHTRHTPQLPVLFENGATDIVDGPFGKYSPALVSALKCFTLCQKQPCLDPAIISLLLQRGSLISSPHYPTGSLIPHIERLAHVPFLENANRVAIIKQVLHLLTTAPSNCHPGFDPIFQAADGLVHSFVGETAEYYAALGDLDGLRNVLAQRGKIRKPVRQSNTVTTLSKGAVQFISSSETLQYFSFNTFCATTVSYSTDIPVFSTRKWMERISLLLEHDGDINALDCIIGRGTSDEIIELEYCTALDLLQVLHRMEINHWENRVGRRIPNKMDVCPPTYLDLASNVLKDYGAEVLPREPVSKGVWRIRPGRYYNRFPLDW